MRRSIRAVLASERVWLGVYLAIVVIATSICVARRCNNFVIFRAAFDHLVAGRDMYIAHPSEHVDLFKYSPTFALLFAPFAALPFGFALLCWNLLNVMALYQALRIALPPDQRHVAIQLVGVGLITTIDGTQSNGLVAALIVLAFAALERDRLSAAASAIVVGALVKIFPLCAAAFVLPRKDRWRFALVSSAVGIAFVALPLLVTDLPTLVAQYKAWYVLSSVDALDRGASAMRLLHEATGYDGPNWPVQLAATALLLLPLMLRPSRWESADFRRAFLASLLLYSVIFNHKAEQPSFVIAVVGMAIWFAIAPRSGVRQIITAATFIATVPMLVTVASPGLIADSMDGPLLVVSACCTIAWLTMQGTLLELFPRRVARPDPAFGTISDKATA